VVHEIGVSNHSTCYEEQPAMIFSRSIPPPGFYVYLYLREDGTPYYVGKGKNKRAWEKHNVNIPKDNQRIKFVATKLLEKEAFMLEIRLIQMYGRKDNNTGILRNITDGGEGSSGREPWNKGKNMPEYVCEKMRTRAIGRVQTSETIAKRILKITGKRRTAEQKLNLIGFKGRTHSNETKEIMAIKKRGKKPSNYDYTIYEWKNYDLELIETLTKSDFSKKYNISSGNISKLFSGERKSAGGWSLI
jgi:hypothetical protein